MGNHKPGDNLTLLNTIYRYAHKDEKGDFQPDSMTLIWKDLDNNKKEHATLYNPKYRYYMLKDGKERAYNQFFVPKEDLIPIEVPYHELEKDIAERTGRLDEFYENIRNKNRRANALLHTDPRLFSSDWDINSFYRIEFDRTYKNNICHVSKCYLDIETDIKYIDNEFPQPGEVPINAISVIMEDQKTEYTFLLRDSNNPKIQEFEKYLKKHDFIGEFKDFLTENLGGWKNVHRFGMEDFEFKLIMFDDELEMLKSLFRLINLIQPDFVLAWNMAFDIPFIIERLRKLNVDPAMIMCHPDFEEKVAEYYIDEMHQKLEERGDKAVIYSYSVYLDQMIQFASRRKGGSAFASFSLDNIGSDVAGVRKLDYHDITPELGNLPYVDYKTFVMYNMMDVIVQKCIEAKTGDIDYVFSNTILNSTKYDKVHRQTVYLTNRAAMFFWDKGFVIGNNINKFLDKPKDKYDGAFVAKPTLVTPKNAVHLHYDGLGDYPVNVYHNANDFDYKSMYPSIAKEWNIAPNTQIGMINIPEQIYAEENWRKYPKFSRAGCFVENLGSQNYLEFCHRWLNLGSYEEVLQDIMEYFSKYEHPYLPINKDLTRGGLLEIAFRLHKGEKLKIAAHVKDENGLIPIVNRYSKPPKDTKLYLDMIKGDM